MSYYYNPYRSSRLVECYCGHVFRSSVKTCQCSVCKVRFDGDERPHKTSEDRAKERIEMDKKLSALETSFNQAVNAIKDIRRQLKPLV